MGRYVLDTDTLVLLQQANVSVATRAIAVPADALATTVINIEEQLRGWYSLIRRAKKSPQIAHAYQRLADTVRFTSKFHIFSFDEDAIDRFTQLKLLKITVRHMDLKIAAIAIENNAILVTRNVRDFAAVPGLIVEDWSK